MSNHLIAESNLGPLYRVSPLCYIAHRKTASDGFETEILRCQLVEAVRKWQGWHLECGQPLRFRYIPMVLKQLGLEETEVNVLHIRRNEETGEFGSIATVEVFDEEPNEEASSSADEDCSNGAKAAVQELDMSSPKAVEGRVSKPGDIKTIEVESFEPEVSAPEMLEMERPEPEANIPEISEAEVSELELPEGNKPETPKVETPESEMPVAEALDSGVPVVEAFEPEAPEVGMEQSSAFEEDGSNDSRALEKNEPEESAMPEVEKPTKFEPTEKEGQGEPKQPKWEKPKPEEQPKPKKQVKPKNTEAARAKKEPTKMETNNGKCIALTVTNNDKSVPIAVFPTESEALDLKEVLESLADVGVTSRNAKYELFETLHRGFKDDDDDSAEKDKKIADLEELNECFESENDELELRIKELTEKCRALENKAQLAGGKKSEDSKVRDLFRTLPSTTSGALRRAAEVWPDRLAILDSAYKSAEDWDEDVAETWEVLTSIATELWQMSFEETPTDFCEEFKTRTGLELSLRESKETRRNPELMRLRTVAYKGSKVKTEAHVKGHGRKKGIRVHYHVDKDLRLIVITHCGRHLKTAGSKRKGY